MAKKLEIRHLRVSDAKRLYEIMNNPNFTYIPFKPKSIEAEKDYIRKTVDSRKKNFSHDYAITYDSKVVGSIYIEINQHRTHIGEIGCYIDENFWGKGLAARAVKKLEKIAFKELGVKRIELIMHVEHKSSEKVAIKCGYVKEGLMRKHQVHEGGYSDVYLYSKVK